MTRYSKLWLAAFSLATVAFAGCTNDEDLGGRSVSSGGGTPSGATKADAGEADGGEAGYSKEAAMACLQACVDNYPESVVTSWVAMDTCYVEQACQNRCTESYYNHEVPTDAGLCGTTKASGAGKSCDDCITTNCCAEWAACYGDPVCVAYGQCQAACPPL